MKSIIFVRKKLGSQISDDLLFSFRREFLAPNSAPDSRIQPKKGEQNWLILGLEVETTRQASILNLRLGSSGVGS